MRLLPIEFKERMQQQLGPIAFEAFEHSLNEVTPVSIRLNPNKYKKELTLEKVAWCEQGYYLDTRPLFVSDPLWHAGAYYVQEASSMALEQAFKQIRKQNNSQLSLLDLCAAPGGKSTHIASLLNEDDVLVSNEVIRTRVPVLNENLSKWGYPNIIITNSDSKDFENCGELFDVILVDAPCSGEGLFRKDENAINEWSVANAEMCSLRQKRILDQITNCLKPGGFIIYSTCTYNPNENELQVKSLCEKGFQPIPFEFNGKAAAMHQCYPHLVKGEGFFIALLQKTEKQNDANNSEKHNPLKRIKDDSSFRPFITHEANFILFRDHIVALSDHTYNLLEQIQNKLTIYSVGTRVCEKNDKLVIPSDYLPFSSIFNASNFEIKALEMAEAIRYLGKNALPNQSNNKGYVCLQFDGVNIGLGKLAGNRINNLFPNEWRLRRNVQSSEWFTISQLD
ncbi:MAG: rRNA methyltransferase [bacterium]|nr:rRNA methyltransferase [bacterium]